MTIENNKESFVQLWLRLESTRQDLQEQYKRYCVRNILHAWFGLKATDDFIWVICLRVSDILDDEPPLGGYDILPPPSLSPRKHRELLRAIVATILGIGMRKVKLRLLDEAYTIAFPDNTPINVNKK